MMLKQADDYGGFQMKRLVTLLLTLVVPLALHGIGRRAEAQQVHELKAGPETVAWGYYVSTKQPVLRIESGDIVEVTTMLTSSPRRLEGAGIPPDEV